MSTGQQDRDAAGRSATAAALGMQLEGPGVYERGPDGLPAAARIYDDIVAPVEQA